MRCDAMRRKKMPSSTDPLQLFRFQTPFPGLRQYYTYTYTSNHPFTPCHTAKLTAVIGTIFAYPMPSPT